MAQDKLDEFAKQLQKEIIDEELRDYNERIVKLFHDPPNWGALSGEDVISHSYLGPCGDTMTIYLRVKNKTIQKANFITTGCGASVATGAQTTLLLEGKSVKEADLIQADTIDNALGGLPADHKHCAELASRTLHQLLDQIKKQSP